MELTTWVGLAGTVLSFTLFVPQALRTWRNRHRGARLDGVSMLGQWIILANAAVWGGYAVLTGAFWTGAPGLINAPLAACTIVLLLRARTRAPAAAAGCQACAAGLDHEVFVTDPAGFGSIMPCTPAARRAGVVIFSTEHARALRALRQ